MIDQTEIQDVAARFGAPDSQIVRDHLISHFLVALADLPDANRVTFFGGTALCRTWLPDLRLSEDIDLLLEDPTEGEELRRRVSGGLRRDFPNLEWETAGARHEVETWTLADDAVDVKVQLAQWRTGWRAIPISSTAVQLRYSDLPESVALNVPSPSGFAAMKLMACP